MSHAAGEAAWAWDLARGTVTRGGALLQITGFTSHEIPLEPAWWRDRIHPEDRASVLAAFDAALAGERRELILLYRFLRKDGSYALLLDRAFVLAPAGSIERIVGFMHEVNAPATSEAPDPASATGPSDVPPAAGQDDVALEYHISSLEQERLHVSRELHDEVGQLLTALRIVLRSDSVSHASAEEIIDELFTRVRDIAAGLRPPMLDDLGLRPTLTWHCDRFTARTGVRVHLIVSGYMRRYPPHLELAVFRVVQEALTNVARHAGVLEAWVSLQETEGQVAGMVMDRGLGFDLESRPSDSSSGVDGMRERVRTLGGRLTVTSKPGRGTRIFFRIPSIPTPRRRERPSSMRYPDEQLPHHNRSRRRSPHRP